MKDIKKKGRGAYDFWTLEGEDILICEWFDNKIVTVASNVHGVEPSHQVRRYDRTAKEYVHINCPALIKQYNCNMGGVDKCDMLLSLYRNEQKSRKWYRRILFHFFDLCVVNAWVLYKALKQAQIPLANFKLDLARAMITSRVTIPSQVPNTHPENRARLSAKNVSWDARYDQTGHFSAQKNLKNAQRCKNEGCTWKTLFLCRKCEVFLCITGKDGEKDCFYMFHQQ